MSRHAPRNGFTLVELLLVMLILGLLATVAVINLLPARSHALREKARADVAVIEQAVELRRLQAGSIPDAAQGLPSLVADGALKRLPTDPWGYAYRYAAPGRHGEFDIWSMGGDGRDGGDGDAADIGNW